MSLRSLRLVLALSLSGWLAGCGSGGSSVRPDANATTTPAERFAKEQRRRQQEAEERQRREDFMGRMDSRRR